MKNRRKILQIGRVIGNIVDKMIDYGGENGQIEISFSELELDVVNRKELFGIIKQMGYDVVYDEGRDVYTIAKREKKHDVEKDKEILKQRINRIRDEMKEEWEWSEIIDLAGLQLDPDDVAKIIDSIGYFWYFGGPKLVWISTEDI